MKIKQSILIDLKDIGNYKSFKNGAFVYDLGHYQGQLLVNEINRLNNIINELEKDISSRIDLFEKRKKMKVCMEKLLLN